ncbi:hypothetical protein GPL21_41215 [Bradyrhizobium pachyrhizi]|uniref:Uncharacterized protein n=1 Tax=Bradyrhizobium pachyrhizi TaxID=280333 RepID=A0A844SZH8_9BRAD|nr:hypothetical protein [Bradyrhizobium pachyrhizi]MVT71406.1 hypothetical protein [Bradyrhizobium pachyrhizi]
MVAAGDFPPPLPPPLRPPPPPPYALAAAIEAIMNTVAKAIFLRFSFDRFLPVFNEQTGKQNAFEIVPPTAAKRPRR